MGDLKLLMVYAKEKLEMLNKVHSKVGSSVDIGEHVLIAMFNITTSMMWGNTLNGEEKHRVTAKFREVSKTMVELIGEANISDFFPLLARFDIQGKERRMKKVFVWFDQIFEFVIGERRKLESEVEDVAHTKEDKQQNKDFLQLLLELIDQEDQKTPFTVTHLKALFGDLMVAGTKTTSTTVEWAMAELLNHPEIMKRAREELDQVVGLNNVVGETHLSKLPYLNAIIKEVFRLHPAGPLLIPRRSRESCIIGGYLIPKGAKIFVNVWAIQRDPKHWNGPLEFRPERFLESSVEWDFSGNDHRYMPFGSGRRICVAAPITENTVCWLLASLLHSFDWKMPEGVKLNMDEQFGIELQKKISLLAVPTPRLFDSKLYQ